MRIEYMSTLEESLEVNLWVLDRDGTHFKIRWKGSLGLGCAAGLMSYVILSMINTREYALLLSPIVSLVIGIAWFFICRELFLQNLRKMLLDLRGTSKPVPIVIEIDPTNIHATIHGSMQDIRYSASWSKIKKIEEGDGTTIFWLKNKPHTFVFHRGFRSPAQQEEFLALAERYHCEALDAEEISNPAAG